MDIEFDVKELKKYFLWKDNSEVVAKWYDNVLKSNTIIKRLERFSDLKSIIPRSHPI